MIYHVVPLAEWTADPGRPYAPASLADDGFVHCSPDEATALAVAGAFYRAAPRPLAVLAVDEHRLTAPCRWEAPDPAPPPGVPDGTLFPHVHGPLDREAVVRVLRVRWDERDRPTDLTPPD
ncbi:MULTISPECIES: DUF952 domain-containing protein [unclassified Streptomyces]|uniref:DUF952 domain-containing protein n=1 Tax=unclassified Streptomyces TaxID=2593676 RepID=UPI002238E767|nr:DUF952 domain-containing protein [Streptomyces sp. SHP 1-2]MCW5249882.1 DUF952 domain-containing protein [Streptomyces sp. SHP 1-2]